MQTISDNQLREMAHKRVEFRIHVVVYLIINSMLWAIWLVTGGSYPWPIWATLGWGIGVLFQYLFEYRSSRFLSEKDEYEKLKKQMENQTLQ